ncbi:MAG: hypothetical protein ACRDVL_04510 [Acidimicrobiia bacterium]
MHIFTYDQVRMLNEERTRRSLTRYALGRHRSRRVPTRQEPAIAEVVELDFWRQRTRQMGA